MKILKKITIFVVVLILSATCCLFYAFKIEPYKLKIKEYNLRGSQVNTNVLKVVQISDLHIKKDFTYKNLQKVVEKINAQNPDIVLFTGDLYDNYVNDHDDQNVISELQKIEAKYSKLAIWGNRDYGGGAEKQYERIMELSGFTLLKNSDINVTLEDSKKILFTGLDDFMLGDPYIPDTVKIHDSDYAILLTHKPEAAKNYTKYDYDITLSGHSHGGQVNIPFLNEILFSSTSFPEEYHGGMYYYNSGTVSRSLYVNTGIGTTHISARLGVVPEITVFNIYL